MKQYKMVNGVQVELTQQEIEARQVEEAAWAAEQQRYELEESYKDKRRAEYPPIGDQLDAIYKAMDEGILPKAPEFYDPIKAVKDKYPKPTV